jgi:hypothetical protein
MSNTKKKKTTFSSAGAELQGRERKRAREEAGVKVVNSDDSEEEEEEAKDAKEKGEPEEKKLKIDNDADEEEGEIYLADPERCSMLILSFSSQRKWRWPTQMTTSDPRARFLYFRSLCNCNLCHCTFTWVFTRPLQTQTPVLPRFHRPHHLHLRLRL